MSIATIGNRGRRVDACEAGRTRPLSGLVLALAGLVLGALANGAEMVTVANAEDLPEFDRDIFGTVAVVAELR
jgi:hypothetical protein